MRNSALTSQYTAYLPWTLIRLLPDSNPVQRKDSACRNGSCRRRCIIESSGRWTDMLELEISFKDTLLNDLLKPEKFIRTGMPETLDF